MVYDCRLMNHKKPSEAIEVIRKGRSLASNNLLLMFLESAFGFELRHRLL